MVIAVRFTVGSLMGRFIGAPSQFATDTPGYDLNARFRTCKGEMFLANVSDDDSSILSLSSARRGERLPKQVILPRNCEYNITPFLLTCAQNDANELVLTSCKLSLLGETMCGTLCASGRGIVVGGEMRRISDAICICIDTDKVTLYADYPIVLIQSLSLRGDTCLSFLNQPIEGSGNVHTIALPNHLKAGALVDVLMIYSTNKIPQYQMNEGINNA